MSVNFPSSPLDGDEYEGYVYDESKTAWKKASTIGTINLNNINDVNIVTPTNGQALVYSSSELKWVNETPVTSLEGLSDTNIFEPVDGQALVYDSDTNSWINETPVTSLEGLSDTVIVEPIDGQTLVYDSDGGKWINITPVSELSGLGDVNLTSLENSQVLSYDSTSSQWTNLTLDFSGDFSPRLLTETTTRTENYTITLNDINRVVPMNGTSLTVTIPTNDSVAFPIGSVVVVYNVNSTNVTVSNAGVTVRNVEPIRQFREASFRKRATNEWVMVGG
jgi:hypothetical protein